MNPETMRRSPSRSMIQASNGLSLLLALAAIALMGTGCSDGGSGGGGAAPISVYFPLTKGAIRTYTVNEPGIGIKTVTETWTNGATYASQATVRNCESATSWEDQANVSGQTLSYGFGDDLGDTWTFSTPVLVGIDNWQPNQTLTTNTLMDTGTLTLPLTSETTYIRKESVTVPAGTFSDSMKITFSIDGGALTGTEWYANGIGLVKSVDSDGETWELVSTGTVASPSLTLIGVSPGIVAVEGGSFLTLTGTDFQSGGVVTIRNKPAVTILVKSSTEIAVEVPANTVLGLTDVAVVNPDCQTSVLDDAVE